MDFEFLIPIVFFGSLSGIAYMFFKTRNAERLALIEKGGDVSFFDDKRKNKFMTLKIGMLAVGVSIGILVGSLLDEYTVLDEQGYLAMIFMFGGISLIASHFIEKKYSV